MVRVVLADDQQLVRAGMRLILAPEPDIEVVGEAADGVEAIGVVQETRPDVVIMDVRMPRMDGIEATRRVVRRPDPPRVLVVTTFDLDEYVYAALREGASGFLLKDAPEEQLISAVRTVAAGVSLLSPGVTRRLRELADRLVVSEATVKTHVGRVLTKLELASRVQAVVLAYETGVVTVGGD